MRHCRRRGNVNLDGVASSKRPLFWMIVAIAAARSVLHDRAVFATALGRFARTLLQHSFYATYFRKSSSYVKTVRIETSGSMTCYWVMLSVFLSPRAWCIVQDEVQMLTSGFYSL